MWSRDTEHALLLVIIICTWDACLCTRSEAPGFTHSKDGGGGARILENDLVTPRLFHFFEVGFLLSSLTVNCHSEAVYWIWSAYGLVFWHVKTVSHIVVLQHGEVSMVRT